MIQRRGISTVVATVLIISMTVIAATLISQFVIPFVKNNLKSSTACFPYEDYFSFDETFGYNCYTDKQVVLSLHGKRDLQGSELEGFNLVLYRQGVADATPIKQSKPLPSNVKMVDGGALIIPGPGDTRTYNYTPPRADIKTKDYLRADVYSILKDGKICEKISDRIDIVSCKGRVPFGG